jgi:hypothetical protein
MGLVIMLLRYSSYRVKQYITLRLRQNKKGLISYLLYNRELRTNQGAPVNILRRLF